MALFSWKCPFHVFVAGMFASTLVSVTSTIVYRYGLVHLIENKKKRIPKELMGTEYDKMLEVATNLALKAGENILEAIKSKSMSISMKGSTGIDFVTETDKLNENIIFTTLKKQFPNHRFIGEESSSASDSLPDITDDPVWIVDPIDGTTNFVHAYPYSSVSIALVVNKSPVVAVAYDPYKDELFQSVLSRGSYLNGQKLTVTDVTDMKNALVVTEIGYGREPGHISRVCQCFAVVMQKNVHSVRIGGSAVIDLCYLASGRVDLVYAGLGGDSWKPWDYAAGILILAEAGGCLSQINGDRFHLNSPSIVAAATNQLRQEMVDLVNHLYK